jgi:DNA sulfur modification protein DndD
VEYREENGEMQQESEYGCLRLINKILPQALSGYFFFDGEHISDINNKKDVVAAVRGLMGLDVISSAVDDLNPSKSSSVVSKLRGELDLGQSTKNERLKADLEAQKSKLENLQKQLADTESEIAYFENRKKDLEAKILANADTKNRQEERARIEKDIQFLERAQETLEAQLVKEFSKNTYKFFAYPLYQKLLNVIAEAKTDGEGIPEMHSKAIDFILSRGKCICGCDLTENQGAVRHIKYEQSLLPPEHIGTTLRKYKEESQRNSLVFEEFGEQIRSTYIRIRENANQLDE